MQLATLMKGRCLCRPQHEDRSCDSLSLCKLKQNFLHNSGLDTHTLQQRGRKEGSETHRASERGVNELYGGREAGSARSAASPSAVQRTTRAGGRTARPRRAAAALYGSAGCAPLLLLCVACVRPSVRPVSEAGVELHSLEWRIPLICDVGM